MALHRLAQLLEYSNIKTTEGCFGLKATAPCVLAFGHEQSIDAWVALAPRGGVCTISVEGGGFFGSG